LSCASSFFEYRPPDVWPPVRPTDGSNYGRHCAGLREHSVWLFGRAAGIQTTAIYDANFFGQHAGDKATTAFNSNFFGPYAGTEATYANDSNFIGYYAGNAASGAAYSTFIGYQTGRNAYNAANSIFIGYKAGYGDTVNNISIPGTSIAIGDYSGPNGYQDSVAIGHGVRNSAQYEMNLGNVMKLTGIYASDTGSSAYVTGATVGLGSNALTTTGVGTFGSLSLTTPLILVERANRL